jgi:hypothetical protein
LLVDAVFTLVRDSAEIRALTGADGNDPRVYQSYDEKRHLVSDPMPAFLVIDDLGGQEPDLDVEHRRFQWVIKSKGLNRARDIADEIDGVLHNADLTPAGWTVNTMSRVGEVPAWKDNEGVWEQGVQYLVEAF